MFSPNRPKFTDKIASGDSLYICTWNTYLKCKTERNCFLENFGWYSTTTKPVNY